jgi:peptidoglycan/LPS O-acetylase OafA/YrhL
VYVSATAARPLATTRAGEGQVPDARRSNALDALRGIAAFLVLAGHTRSYVFQSYHVDLAAAGAPISLTAKAFYLVTALGTRPVMLFFALSGFLVGGKALGDIFAQQFDWSRYLLRRLTRLWIVVVPALILTLSLDHIGLSLGPGHDTRYYEIYGTEHSFRAFLGNLGFLQTIVVPSFGSNTPLWSLANEFWYYILFPLAASLALAPMSLAARVSSLLLLTTIIAVLPLEILKGAIVFFAGAGAAFCSRRRALEPIFRAQVVRVAAVALLVAALIDDKVMHLGINEIELGLVTAFVLPFLANMPQRKGALATLARASSEISYSLYLTHLPLLTLIVTVAIAPQKWPPGLMASGVYAGLITAALVWACVIWSCFERNTGRVYARLARALPSSVADFSKR